MGALADALVTVPLEENQFVASRRARVWQQFGSAPRHLATFLTLILMWYVAGPNFRYRCDGRGVRACKSDGALGDDPLLDVLKSGGFHLAVTDVVPVGGGAGKERVLMLFSA